MQGTLPWAGILHTVKLPKILKIKFGYIANSRVIKYVSKLYISMPGVNQAKMICCWQKYDGRVCQNNTAK